MIERKKSTQRSLDLEVPLSTRRVLPSPKRTRQDSIVDGEMPWGLAYAAFARSFASAAISELRGSSKHTIVDPFVGSGTTVEASIANGCNCIGIDLNPYSALTSRVRGVQKPSIDGIRQILSSLMKACEKKDPANGADPVAVLIGHLESKLKIGSGRLIQELCSQRGSDLDDELVALCCVTYAARIGSSLSRGSNPTWPQDFGGGNSEPPDAATLIRTAELVSAQMLDNLRGQVASKGLFVQIFNSDFSDARIADGSIKRFLTSPPYLNRLDYVRSNLTEIQRLTASTGEEIEGLRSLMMGTTKIRMLDAKTKSLALSSLTANSVLDEIRCHPTKASGTYYFQFFLQYFLDLERFFAWLAQKTAAGGVGMIVLQNSYYKELPIPLAEIYQEMADMHGFDSTVEAEWKKSNHIGQMSPAQRKHAPNKVLTESVVRFEKTRSQ